jgi:hypothetical protein
LSGWGRDSARRRSIVTARPMLGLAFALIVLVTALAMSPRALAGTPEPTSAALGDPRSSGQGPGLVGDPVAAIALVLLIGIASVAITIAYLRATERAATKPDG